MVAIFAAIAYGIATTAFVPPTESTDANGAVGRMLGGKSNSRSPKEQALEVFTYVVSFGAFYLFVFMAMRLTRSPTFRREAGGFSRLLHACAIGDDQTEYSKDENGDGANGEPPESFGAAALRLAVCTIGIQVSYLLWGLMQERIMTKPYESGELFRSSKFLVFANRFLALFAAWGGLLVTGEPVARAARGTPLYKFSFSSVSNILSSVCQYEALKFVSFPTQVLAKSCKMVPVMLMGYVVNKKTYSAFEYAVALGVSAGAAVFKLYETNDAPVKNTELLGIVLIVGYMGSDSFTSNWQSSVFKSYGVSSMAMMLYANLFSSAFTALGLLVTLEIVEVIHYFERNPSIIPHMAIMAVCSAIGQLFIFHTIKRFGPLVFATIQTVRQFLSVVLSILFFAHPLNTMEAVGIAIVFTALGGQILQKWMAKRSRPSVPTPPPPLPKELEAVTANSEVDSPKASLLRTHDRQDSRLDGD